ncbi:MAG: hypothetical protein HRU41_20440 [Saprospiraceae bacterium]|nr:hypothetical protein [Saprospiraceae bacterium]
MKIVQLSLFLTITWLLSSCQKAQIVSKIDITTMQENSAMGNESPLVLDWKVEVVEEGGIEGVTILFSDVPTPLEFPMIFRDSWSVNDTKEFALYAIPETWTITVIVRNQEGNISEETSTINL